ITLASAQCLPAADPAALDPAKLAASLVEGGYVWASGCTGDRPGPSRPHQCVPQGNWAGACPPRIPRVATFAATGDRALPRLVRANPVGLAAAIATDRISAV